MIKNKTTVFFFLTVGLLCYSFFEYQKGKKNFLINKQSKTIMPGVSPSNLKEFKYVVANGLKSFFMVKKNNTWVLQTPVRYPADQDYLQLLLEQLLNDDLEKISDPQDNSEKIMEYGLDKPLLTVGFKDSQGNYQDVLVGSILTTNNKVFLKKIDSNEVWVASGFWQNLEKKTAYDFRWKNMYKHIEPIQTVVVRKSGGTAREYSYLPQKQHWSLVTDEVKILTKKNMGRLIQSLETLLIFRFLSEEQDENKIKKYGLDDPLFELEFYFKKKNISSWHLKVSHEDQEKFYATLKGRPQIFQLNKKEVRVLKKHLNTF